VSRNILRFPNKKKLFKKEDGSQTFMKRKPAGMDLRGSGVRRKLENERNIQHQNMNPQQEL